MIGAALGAAMMGLRPVVEIMYADFMLVAMDQIVNQVANARYVSAGGWTAPLVIRTQGGHSPGSCAQHSQSLEAMIAHTPGLLVALPSTPQDAYDILRSAIQCDDPVMVLENRMLYGDRADLVLDGPIAAPGGSRFRRRGNDVTIVGWSRAAQWATAAASQLESRGVQCDVIDLRWLSPLDLDPVVESVHRTGHLVVAHEAVRTSGFGAEVVSRVYEQCFEVMKAPAIRVAAKDVPIPASPELQGAVFPNEHSVVEAVLQLRGTRERVTR
jgi:pyruvate/2-oxoglutarate/acetoin dehydrogenase E1 component